jgi:hypothetical protein
MCQWTIKSRFNRAEEGQIWKVASLSAQALSNLIETRRLVQVRAPTTISKARR